MSEPFPLPGEDFNRRKLVLRRPSKAVIRINKIRFPNPLFWSRQGKYRFDSTKAPYGVLYAASDVEGAILEVFADVWLEDHRRISLALLETYEVVEIRVSTDLRLVNTLGKQLNLLGADSRLFASTEYHYTQSWGRAFMTHPREPDGILYHSRKNPRKFNYAFFEKDSAAISFQIANRFPLTTHPALDATLDRYQVAVL
jgi:RES domain